MAANAEESWSHHQAVVNGIRLHWVEQGRGPLVVLLHGFPEFWYSWRRQIPVLAERFRVVAPDLRGYNRSEKPASGYDLATLSDDLLALIRALGEEGAAIVGHDWGGVIAWDFARRYPGATHKLVVMNAPHPLRFQEEWRRPRQLLRSSYALFFQLPRLPELLLGANRCRLLVSLMRRSAVRKEAFSDEDLERYREAMSQPGALTCALNYYRAAFRRWRRLERPPREGRVQAPTLMLWGTHDPALGNELTYGLERWVPNLTIHYLECGHWTQQERSDQVNRYLLEFLQEAGAQESGLSPAPLGASTPDRP